MSSFANRVALITGAGSGLGRQLALTLAGEGAAVAAIDRQPEGLESLAAQLAGKPSAWAVADVTDRPVLHHAIDRLRKHLGPIDLLIASAGIGQKNATVDFDAELFEAHVRINLLGVANSIAAVVPEMVARKQGHLVAISSVASFRGLPDMAGYCASKAGLNALLDTCRIELKPHGIRVTTVCPSWIRTPMTDSLDVPKPQIMEADEAARRILRAIQKNQPFIGFPRRVVWMLRLLGWLPAGISDWMAMQALRNMAAKEKKAAQ